jgi:hypothetical protein
MSRHDDTQVGYDITSNLECHKLSLMDQNSKYTLFAFNSIELNLNKDSNSFDEPLVRHSSFAFCSSKLELRIATHREQ